MDRPIIIPKGKVYICGAGPGEPNLLTLKAAKLLSTCDVILYDRLVNKRTLKMASQRSKKVYVGRESGDPTTNQLNTNELMLKFAKKGKKVLRLKGGDPFIFGRGGEEAEFLKLNNICFEIIPGITSGIGAAIYSGIPLTHRKYSSSVAFVTGHEDPEKKTPVVKWEKLFEAVDTVVIYMGTEKLELIINKIKGGKIDDRTPVAIIQNSTLKNQKIITGNLGNIVSLAKEYDVEPPSIVIIGDIVNLHKKIKWYNQYTNMES